MPGLRMPEVSRAIEDCHAKSLAVYRTPVVHPVCPFAPRLSVLYSRRGEYMASARHFRLDSRVHGQRIGKPQAENAILVIPKQQRPIHRLDRNVEIQESAAVRQRRYGYYTRIGGDKFVVRRPPLRMSRESTLTGAAMQRCEARGYSASNLALFAPEINSVHAAMCKPEPSMMNMIMD